MTSLMPVISLLFRSGWELLVSACSGKRQDGGSEPSTLKSTFVIGMLLPERQRSCSWRNVLIKEHRSYTTNRSGSTRLHDGRDVVQPRTPGLLGVAYCDRTPRCLISPSPYELLVKERS